MLLAIAKRKKGLEVSSRESWEEKKTGCAVLSRRGLRIEHELTFMLNGPVERAMEDGEY